ncbi:hypothetical protein V8E54_002982 [Elaphomyces granulatus]
MPSFNQSLLRRLLLSLVIHLSLPPACLANSAPDTVSITFTWIHTCAGYCLDGQGYDDGDLVHVVSCDSPVYNYCFCPTDTKSIDSIRSWLSQCVSAGCHAPDFTTDVSAVESGYASYCIEAGYSQSGATTWFEPTPTPAPTQAPVPTSTEGASPGTMTLVTVVTSTTEPTVSFGKSGWVDYTLLRLVPTIFAWAVPLLMQVLTYMFKYFLSHENNADLCGVKVTEESTSTAIVTASTDTNNVPDESTSTGTNQALPLGLGLGLGLGIPFLLGCIIAWYHYRRSIIAWYRRSKRKGSTNVLLSGLPENPKTDKAGPPPPYTSEAPRSPT